MHACRSNERNVLRRPAAASRSLMSPTGAPTFDTVAGYLREVPLDVIGRSDWVLARWGPESQGWLPAAEAAPPPASCNL